MSKQNFSKEDIEYRAYIFFRVKGLEYVDNIDELIEYCSDFAYPFISYFEEKIAELKETLAQTIENDEVNYETLKLHDQEEIGMLNSKIAGLEQKIEKMKCCQNCKSEDNDYMEKPCCECSRCLGDIKRKGTTDKWEIEEND